MQVSAGLLASSDGQLSVMCLPVEGRFSNGETPYTSRARDIPKHVPLGVWLRVFHCLSQFETVQSVSFENDRLWGGSVVLQQVTEAASGTVALCRRC